MAQVLIDVDDLKALRDTAVEVQRAVPDLVRAKPALEALERLRQRGVDLNVLIGRINDAIGENQEDVITMVDVDTTRRSKQ